MKKLPKAIIFDWDNTLIDTWPLIHSAIDETMVKMGKEPWGIEKVKQNVYKSMRESFPAIFGDDWEKAGQIYKDSYHKNHLDNLTMLPDALKMIDFCLQLKIKLFVVSNKVGSTLRKEASHIAISDKFEALIGAQDAIYDKPSKEVVDLALEGYELDPKRDLIWFVGDSFIDIECALISGCQPVLLHEKNDLSPDLLRRVGESKDKPLLHFSSHQQIIDFLGELLRT